jgi:hypothetical protein
VPLPPKWTVSSAGPFRWLPRITGRSVGDDPADQPTHHPHVIGREVAGIRCHPVEIVTVGDESQLRLRPPAGRSAGRSTSGGNEHPEVVRST